MVDLIHRLINLLFFSIPLLYYANFNLAIICYLSLRDMYLFSVNINSSIISKNMHLFQVLTLIQQHFAVFLLEICIFFQEKIFLHLHYYQLILQNAIHCRFFSKHLLFYQQLYYRSSHQLLLLFFELLFLMLFLLHLLQIFSTITKFQTIFIN